MFSQYRIFLLLVLTFHYTFSSCHYRYGSFQSVLWNQQQLGSSCHIGPVLRSHSVRVCLLPLQTQVGAAENASYDYSCTLMYGELHLPKWKICLHDKFLPPQLIYFPSSISFFLYFLVLKLHWGCQSNMPDSSCFEYVPHQTARRLKQLAQLLKILLVSNLDIPPHYKMSIFTHFKIYKPFKSC